NHLLYVSLWNKSCVAVIDLAEKKIAGNIPTERHPTEMVLASDGKTLYVACANSTRVSVIDTDRQQSRETIACALYPNAPNGNTPQANPQGPDPLLPKNQTTRQYIAGLYRGTLSTVDLPTPEQMAKYSKQAYACSPLRADQGVRPAPPKDSPIPALVGGASPIKHCIYVIKENRTYDQVLGDMKEGNGDADLCLFPESVTPNHHRLAREFVLLD